MDIGSRVVKTWGMGRDWEDGGKGRGKRELSVKLTIKSLFKD